MTRTLSLALLAPLVTLSAPTPALAQSRVVTADPSAETVAALDAGLLAIMHAGAAAGQAGRARLIGPVIDRAFDLPLMTRLSVGPAWTTIPAAQQEALVAAFRAHTIAQYARNFDGFSGERFVQLPGSEPRGLDRLVRTSIVPAHGETEALNYRLRQSASGQWKIIDIYYRNAISQLATRRSDFAAMLAKGGAPALIAHLNALATNPK